MSAPVFARTTELDQGWSVSVSGNVVTMVSPDLDVGAYTYALTANGSVLFAGPLTVAPESTPRAGAPVTEVQVAISGANVAVTALGGGGGGGGEGTPAVSVVAETSLSGASSAVGTSGRFAREDHTHGTPLDAVPSGPGDLWVEGQSYVVSDERICPLDGQLYRCITAHTAWVGTNWQPSVSPTLWTPVTG